MCRAALPQYSKPPCRVDHVKILPWPLPSCDIAFTSSLSSAGEEDSLLSTNFFNREEVPGKKDIHMHVKELDPDMYLALPGRIARLPLGWQGTASSMAPNTKA